MGALNRIKMKDFFVYGVFIFALTISIILWMSEHNVSLLFSMMDGKIPINLFIIGAMIGIPILSLILIGVSFYTPTEIKRKCEICGKETGNFYSYNIYWTCYNCHKLLHKKRRKGK